jgi:dTDP-4-amino-4,6-dideoxygalactose transaminase
VARFAERDTARARLAELGVGTAVHYPLAVNQQPAYRCLSRTAYPHAEAWAAQCVSLPCFAQMTDAEVDTVAAALAALAPEADRS